MARQFDFHRRLTVIRAFRTVSTSPGSAAGSPPVPGPAKGPGAPAGEPSAARLLNKLQSDRRFVSLLHSYENLVGIGDVKRAQTRVTEIEEKFMEVREAVQKSAKELHEVQAELRSVRAKLDRTPRDDAKFLEYATEEHLAIQQERKLEAGHAGLEDAERATFARLSAAVRASHERQRAQEERTKYWGVLGSLLGTVLGLLGSTLVNQRRMRELRSMVADLQADVGQGGGLWRGDLEGLLGEIRAASGGGDAKPASLAAEGPATSVPFTPRQREALDAREGRLGETLKRHEAALLQELDDMRQSTAASAGDVTAALESLMQQQRESLSGALKQQEASLLREMQAVRRSAAVGPGDVTMLEELVQSAEQKLEWEMKMSTLSTVVFIYGAFALTLPILYSIFK